MLDIGKSPTVGVARALVAGNEAENFEEYELQYGMIEGLLRNALAGEKRSHTHGVATVLRQMMCNRTRFGKPAGGIDTDKPVQPIGGCLDKARWAGPSQCCIRPTPASWPVHFESTTGWSGRSFGVLLFGTARPVNRYSAKASRPANLKRSST